MAFKKLHEHIKTFVSILQRFVDRLWYPPLVALLALLDNLIVVVPTDGILISSSMLTPRRWALLAFSVSVGSTVGAIILAGMVEVYGLPWILHYYPAIDETMTWQWTSNFFDTYGMILVFFIAASPLMQQPTVIIAGLANTPLVKLAAVIFAGRFAKYLLMAYLGSHAPRVLGRLWGVKGELADAGVKIDATPPR